MRRHPTLLTRILTRLLPCLLLLTCACARRDERWNVLLVTLDTTRADFFGCYGQPGSITPAFDALAAQGTRFDRAIATASVTPVSHASILTGLDNKEHGVRVLLGLCGFRLPQDVPTLATVLKQHGWATAAVHSAFPVSRYFGFERGYDSFESFDSPVGRSLAGNLSWDLMRFQRRSDQTTDLTLERLQRTARPFFLWVHYWDPHDNVQVPPPQFLTPDVPRLADGSLPLSRELYAAEISYVDAQFGRLVQALQRAGEWERTLVVVVADHGEGLGDHGWQFHRILYQEQIRVPLIVRVPGVAQAPSQPGVVRTTDIYPTVLDYLGLRAPRNVSGRSLRALLEGREDAPRVAFADQINGYDLNAAMLGERPLDDFLYAVVEGDHKLVYRPSQPAASELFDLGGDPGELANLYGTRPEVELRLKQHLAQHAGWVTRPCTQPEDGAGDLRAAQAVLAGLGYTPGEGPAVETRWAFACPEHGEVLSEAPEPCRRCGARPLLVPRP